MSVKLKTSTGTVVVTGLDPADESKLDGIEPNAKDDQTPEEIQTAYDSQVAAASQAEVEAGTETAVRRMSPLRVKQAIDVNGSSGRELDYAQSTAQDSTNTTKKDIADCVITFTVGSRPVHVYGYATVSNNVAGANTVLEITNESNVQTDGSDAVHTSSAAGEVGVATAHERIATPGAYTRKLRFQSSSATAGSALVNVVNLGKAWIIAVEM